MLANISTMGFFDWVWLLIAVFISMGIVERSKLSNWAIIPVSIAVFIAGFVLVFVLKLLIPLIIICVVGMILWGYLHKKKKEGK